MKHITNRILTCLISLGVSVLPLLSSAQSCAAAGPTTTTVRIGWIGDTHFTDMYVMSKMLKDPTIQLKMEKFHLSQDELNALAANDIDMASMGYVFFLKLLDNGVDVTAVSGVSEGGSRLLLRKDMEAKKWSDFSHLRVGVARGSTQELQFQSCLSEHKVPLKSVHTVVFTNAVDMEVGLQQGVVDAAMMWEPQASQAIIKGIGHEFRPVYPCAWRSNGMLVVRTDFLKKHPKAVEAILKSLSAVAKDLSSNHKEWVTEAQQFAPLPENVQSMAIDNSGESVVLHTSDLPKMARIMLVNSYLRHKLQVSDIKAHIDLGPLSAATGKTKNQLEH